MKKLILLSSVAVALCSCSNEITNVEEMPVVDRTIQFDAYVPGQTRAVAEDATAESVAENGFRVMAWNATTNEKYFSDIFAAGDNNRIVGETQQDYEWPISASLDFYAVYPTTTGFIYFEEIPAPDNTTYRKTDSLLVMTQDEDRSLNGTKDVLFSKLTNKTQAGGKVQFSFQHLLMKVGATLCFDEGYLIEDENTGETHGPKLEKVTLEGVQSAFYRITDGTWSSPQFGDTTTVFTLFTPSVSTYGETTPSTLQEGEGADAADCSVMIIPAKYKLTVEYDEPDELHTKTMETEVDLSNKEYSGKAITLNIRVKDNRITFAAPTINAWGEPTEIDVAQ